MLNNTFFKSVRIGQFVLAIAIYLYYSLVPGDKLHLTTPDKYLHFTGNVLLYLSCWVALYGRFRMRLLIALLIPYSLAIELCQHFSPGRTVDSADMLANMLGLTAGFAIAFLVHLALRQFCPSLLEVNNRAV